MTPYNRLPAAITLCFLAALTPLSQASEQRAHQHGHAQLQIAVENNSIDLILTSPAQNLLGFEHQPRTQQQKHTLENARQWLTTEALITPADGNCTVKSASMEFSATATKDSRGHHDDDHHHNEAIDEHANIEVSQLLNCTGADLNGRLTSPLIDQFAEIQELSVEWVTSRGQGSTKLNAPNDQFRF